MSENPNFAKESLRRELRAENRRRDAERSAASGQIVLRLKEQPLWKNSRSILFFSLLPGEPDLRTLCQEAIASGKAVAFPRYIEATDSYRAFQITDSCHDFMPGKFGIPEPNSSCAELPLNKLDFVLVPGLGFSLSGARLGRGKGYYDRLLASVSAVRCGVAFDWQIVAELPIEPHDILLDCLVTPSLWRDFRAVG